MKKSICALFFSLGILSPLTQASEWYGVCYGTSMGKTLCSTILTKTPDFSHYCHEWSKSYGASTWGNFTGTSIEQLKKKQDMKCDKILSAPPSGPSDLSFRCLAVVTCTGSDGTTSSQNAEVVGNVSAEASESKDDVLKECLKKFDQEYLDKLEDTSHIPSCHLRAEIFQE